MSSPITFSGFNQIDFNVVLNAVMRQESRPLEALQKRKEQLEAVNTRYGTLSTKLGALKAAAAALSNGSSVTASAATSSAPASVSVSAGGAAALGRYEVVVNDLAKAQVMVTSSTAADANTTTVATAGTLIIDGVAVTISGAKTLSGLAQAINATSGLAVTARVSQTAPGEFRLILTSDESGAANAFTVQNALTGSVTFTDTDHDGTSGDDAADNAVQAQNASLLVNNVEVESTTNTLTSVVEGLTLTLLKADPDATVVVDVVRDDADLVERIKTFVSAYNDLTTFADGELAKNGTFGRDALMRSLRNELRAALSDEYGSGPYTRLAEVGVGFTRTGKLELNETALREAITADPDAVTTLFSHGTTGAFGALEGLVDAYIEADGHVPDARARLTDELSRLGTRIASMEASLALRRQALQREYAAADAAMARLNAQAGTITNLGLALRSTKP
jgi:flagellar hook-associated protein 2